MTHTPLQIREGVPLPPDGRTRRKYRIRDMEIGDSVVVQSRSAVYVSRIVSGWKEQYGYTFTQRQVEGGIGVWRVA